MDPNVSMLEVNPAQLEVLESLMQLRNEEPNTNQAVSVPVQGTEEAVQTSIVQMEGEMEGEAENQMVTIVPMEDVQSDKMVTFIAVDEMGNRVHLPDDVVTFVSVDDDGNTIQLECSDLTQEQMQVIQVGMDLEAASQEGGKVNIMQGAVESIEVYKCDLCRQVFTKRTDWDDHDCPGHQDDQEAILQPLAIQLEQQQAHRGVVIKEEDDSSLECNLCHRSFALRENWEQHMLSHLDKIEARPNTELEMKQLSIVDSGSNAVVLSAKTGDVEYRCDACGKRYQEKTELEKHLVTHIVDKFYECPICSSAFATKFSLRKHVINHLKGKGKPFKCELCEKAFNQKVNLRAHMSVHTGLREFKCHICQKEFSLKGNLNKHLRIHTDERPFKCNICGRSFKVKEYLIQHRLTHSSELPFACGQCGRRFKLQEYADRHTLKCDGTRTSICEQCGMSYASRGDLNRHIDEVHPEMKPYQCPTCNKRFKLKSYLQQHELSHTAGRNWVCGVCKKDFKCRHSLRQHLMWHSRQEKNEKFTCEVCGKEIQYELNMKRHMLLHTGNMPFTCEVCQRGFPDSSHLRRHMMRHNGEKPHKCELCGKGFYTSTHLKRHVKTHSSLTKPFACKICGKGFLTEEKMTRHFETHYGAVKGRFKCKYCDKACNKRSDLSRHTLIHTGEKPYKCEICGLAFRTSTHRKRHLLTHTTEKPFKCSECNKAFKSRDVLKKHEAIHKEGKSGWKKYCPKCGKGFKFVFKLREHEKRGCENDVEQVKSEETEKKSENQQEVSEDKVKTETPARPHKCAMCNRSFKTIDHLSRHEATHKDDEGETSLLDDESDEEKMEQETVNDLQCKQCSKQFEEKSDLEKHRSYCKVKPQTKSVNYINKKKPKQKGNQCILCGKVFVKGSHALKQHISLMHTVEDFAAAKSPVPDTFYKCDDCGKLFAQAVNWKKHLLTHKEEGEASDNTVGEGKDTDATEKPHKCGFCSISFRESTNLVKHLLALHYKKPADSSVPGTFTSEVSQDESKENEVTDKTASEDQSESTPRTDTRDKPYKCEKCPKQFGHITFLNKHILSQHPPPKIKKTDTESNKALSEYSSIEFPFACDDCGVKFRTPGGLNTHKESLCQNVHSCEEGSPYKSPDRKVDRHNCNVCDSVQPTASALLKHMRKTHKHIKFPCYVCGKGYAKETGLKQHITIKHGEPKTPRSSKVIPEPESRERKFTCEHCQRGFRTESQLKRHIPTHKEEHADFIKKEPLSPVAAGYSCDACSQTFHLHSELKNHMLKMHADDSDNSDDQSVDEDVREFEIVRGGGQTELSVAVEKLLVCDECGEWFSSPYDYKTHKSAVHGREEESLENIITPSERQTFSCEQCDTTFSSRFKLNRHTANKHESEKSSSPSRTRSQLSVEKKSKAGTPIQSKSTTKSSPAVKTSSKPTTPVKKPSERKSKSAQKSSSEPSMLTYSPRTADRAYRCRSCKREFRTESQLNRHERTHNKEETDIDNLYKCDICDEAFPKSLHLKRHMASHTSDTVKSDDEVVKASPHKSKKKSSEVSELVADDHKGDGDSARQSPRQSQSASTKSETEDIKIKSPEVKPVSVNAKRCNICKKLFSSIWSVKVHLINVHNKKESDVILHKCTICRKSFGTFWDLKKHKLTRHRKKPVESEILKQKISEKIKKSIYTPSGERITKCDLCGGWFPNITEHMLCHKDDVNITMKIEGSDEVTEGKKKFTCDICGKSYGKAINWKMHKMIHKTKKGGSGQAAGNPDVKNIHECAICGKEFLQSSSLKVHISMKHGEYNEKLDELKTDVEVDRVDPPVVNTCEHCQKDFPELSEWYTHKLTSCGEGSPQCICCEKLFKKTWNLKIHYFRVHNIRTAADVTEQGFSRLAMEHTYCRESDLESMQCPHCSKKFTAQQRLKQHLKMHKRKGVTDTKAADDGGAEDDDDDAVASSQDASDTLDEISITLPEQSGEREELNKTEKTVSSTQSEIPGNHFIVTVNSEEKKSELEAMDTGSNVVQSDVKTLESDVNAEVSEIKPMDCESSASPTEEQTNCVNESGDVTNNQIHLTSECSISDQKSSNVEVVESFPDTTSTDVAVAMDTAAYNQLQLDGNAVVVAHIDGEGGMTYQISDAVTGDAENSTVVYITNSEVLNSETVGVEMQTDTVCESSVTYYEETVTGEAATNPASENSDQNKLYEQALSQLVEGEKRYKCEVCGRQCSTTWSLKQHMETHGTSSNITEQNFAQMLDLVQTGNSAPFKCDICGRTFSKTSQLTRHRATHKEQN